jgi:hypothetical protein
MAAWMAVAAFDHGGDRRAWRGDRCRLSAAPAGLDLGVAVNPKAKRPVGFFPPGVIKAADGMQ